jgi:2-oxoglutarate dehydrogenase E2 component (dihydrolipoamide succinyltransferase)
MTDIVVPTLGESVSEATVAKWMKKAGDSVRKDETLVELETDKVSVEVSAPEGGVLSEIVASEGTTVGIGAILGRMAAAGAQPSVPPAASRQELPAQKAETPKPPSAPQPAAASNGAPKQAPPSVQRIAAENNVDVSGVPVARMAASPRPMRRHHRKRRASATASGASAAGRARDR